MFVCVFLKLQVRAYTWVTRATFLHREKLGVNDGALVLKFGTKLGDSWFNESIVG